MIESGERTDGRDGIIIKESEEGRVLRFEGRMIGCVNTWVSIAPLSRAEVNSNSLQTHD